MANAKREHDVDVAIQIICKLGSSFNGKPEEVAFNKYTDVDRIKTPEELKAAAKEGMEALKAGLKHIAAGRG